MSNKQIPTNSYKRIVWPAGKTVFMPKDILYIVPALFLIVLAQTPGVLHPLEPAVVTFGSVILFGEFVSREVRSHKYLWYAAVLIVIVISYFTGALQPPTELETLLDKQGVVVIAIVTFIEFLIQMPETLAYIVLGTYGLSMLIEIPGF
ncbi:MAG: hypothetical protein ACOZAO_01935 [Patescibacteria group bacterium]